MFQPSVPTFDHLLRRMDLRNGLELAWTDEGTGEKTLVFVHGMASNLRAWRKNIPVLRDDFRCISLDLPNFGDSSRGDYPMSIPFLSGVLREFLRPLEGEQVVLVEADRPENLLSLDPEQVVRTYELNFHHFPADAHFMLEDMAALAANGEYPHYCETLRRCVFGMVSDPIRTHFPAIQQDLLVLFGEDDALIPHPRLHADQSPRALIPAGVHELPRAQLQFFEQCGHFLQWEQSERFNQAVRDFLVSHPVNPKQ